MRDHVGGQVAQKWKESTSVRQSSVKRQTMELGMANGKAINIDMKTRGVKQ